MPHPVERFLARRMPAGVQLVQQSAYTLSDNHRKAATPADAGVAASLVHLLQVAVRTAVTAISMRAITPVACVQAVHCQHVSFWQATRM